jgi:scyllo-inositol 2-dehydrogenase (NADP+)
MDARSRKIQVGIAGTGQVARVRHIPAYKRDPRASIVAFYNPKEDAEVFAKAHGVPHVYSDLETFLEHPFDALSICTPPQTHARLAEAALRAGKHVLVEKPMTMSAREGQALESLARDEGLVLCPSHNFLFNRAMTRVKTLMEEGKLGQVTGATALQWSSWRRRLPDWFPELPGGLFFDESPHLIYLLSYFLGDLEVANAWHTDESMTEGQNIERFDVSFRGQRGWGSMSMWFGAPMSEWWLAVGFTRGTVVIDIFRDVLLWLPPELKRNYRYILEIPTRGTLQLWRTITRWITHRLLRGRHLYGHEELIRRYLDSVASGEEPPVSPSEGWKTIGLIEDVIESAGVPSKR